MASFKAMRVSILVATCLLALATLPSIQGSQIYLQSIEIATTHDRRTKPSVYLTCNIGNSSNDETRTDLPEVTETNKIYTFDHDKPVVSVEASKCASCTLMEYDRNAKDDVFGTLNLCHDKIAKAFKSQLSVLEIGEFHAVFSCPTCTGSNASPQPLPPGTVSPSPVHSPLPHPPAQVAANSHGEGSPVHLQSLEIATTHDRITKPYIYLTCKVGNNTSDDIKTELPVVKEASKIYSFVAENLEIVSLKADQCATCTLREHDRNSKDDVFGEVELCSDKIARARKHRLSVLQIGEFHAVFSCPTCTSTVSSPQPKSLSAPPMPYHQAVTSKQPASPQPASPQPASNQPAPEQPAPEDDVSPSLWWRFITGAWPLSTENTTWGVVTVQSFSSNDCTGNPLVLDEVSYGGGNWSFARAADVSGKTSNQAGGSAGDHGIEVNSAAEIDDDAALHFYTSSFEGPQQYQIMPSMSCKDDDMEHMHATTMLGCSEMCNLLKQCRAFTYNTETKDCFLKNECLKLRQDRQRADVSGIKISHSGKDTLPDHEDYLVEAVVGEKEAELMAKMDHWKSATNRVHDSPSGGSYISLKLSEPAVVQCMRFVVPPALKANFPQAARIQYSTDGGASWVTSQGIEPIGQDTLLVKTVSKSINVAELEAQLNAALQPDDSAVAKFDETFAYAIEAAMNAVKDASRGVNFSDPATGFVFTAGMMAVGFVLAWGCTYCCKRRKVLRRKAYEDSFRTPAEGGDFLSDIELGSTPDKSLLQPVAGLVSDSIDSIKSTLSPSRSAKKGKSEE